MLFIRAMLIALLMPSPVAWAEAPTVAVDVGHGLKDGGSISARGRSEFAFNQVLAVRLAEALQGHGLGVRAVNFAGDIGRLAERPQQAVGSDFFIASQHDSDRAA